jgi:hypothetical protein
MDERLKQALDFSNYNQTLSLKRKFLKEKSSSKLTFGHNGGIFKIDRSLIVFIQMLVNQGRIENIPVLDSNDNPVLIKDLKTFFDEILDRYFSVVYEYHEEYEKIKKSRSVEKLVDYE